MKKSYIFKQPNYTLTLNQHNYEKKLLINNNEKIYIPNYVPFTYLFPKTIELNYWLQMSNYIFWDKNKYFNILSNQSNLSNLIFNFDPSDIIKPIYIKFALINYYRLYNKGVCN